MGTVTPMVAGSRVAMRGTWSDEVGALATDVVGYVGSCGPPTRMWSMWLRVYLVSDMNVWWGGLAGGGMANPASLRAALVRVSCWYVVPEVRALSCRVALRSPARTTGCLACLVTWDM